MDNLQNRLNSIEERIDAAVRRAGRSRDEVRLMAVSKTRLREEIEEAYDLGLRLFGENRILEAKEKFQDFPADTELHLIGHLQRNKAKAAAQAVSCVQSIDKISTALALEKQCAALDKSLSVFIEINTSGESSKEGTTSSEELYPMVEELLTLTRLKVVGLMTMAPFTDDQEAIRASFRTLRSHREDLSRRFSAGDFSELSMGMSSDFEIAIEEGSNLVRVGTLLFGPRRLA